MSAITATPDPWGEPVTGLGPSMARAFLHALATRLNRAARACGRAIRAVARDARDAALAVIRAASATLRIAFVRGGIQASAGLVLAAVELSHYAVVNAVEFVRSASGRVIEWARTVPVRPRWRLVRDLAVHRWWVTLPLLAGGVAVAVVGVTRRRDRQVNDTGWELNDDEREQLTTKLYVVLATDGSVRVHGIPATLTPAVRTRIAQTAAQAAEQRLESLVARGRPLTSLDLQAVNVAARSAISQHIEQQAA